MTHLDLLSHSSGVWISYAFTSHYSSIICSNLLAGEFFSYFCFIRFFSSRGGNGEIAIIINVTKNKANSAENDIACLFLTPITLV